MNLKFPTLTHRHDTTSLSSIGALSFLGGRDCNRVGLAPPAAVVPAPAAGLGAGPVAPGMAHIGCRPGETSGRHRATNLRTAGSLAQRPKDFVLSPKVR